MSPLLRPIAGIVLALAAASAFAQTPPPLYLPQADAQEENEANTTALPIMRSGLRSVLAGTGVQGSLELQFAALNADVQKGDQLVTSGIDGVYPPGLHVGTVSQIDRRVDSSFARVHAIPAAKPRGRHLLVLMPTKDWPTVPTPPPEPKRVSKGRTAAASSAGVKP